MIKINIFILAFSLALDAAGTAMAVGCGTVPNLKEKLYLIFSFGIFQFLFALTGALLGNYINQNLINISNLFSAIILLILGVYLIFEGYKNEDECIYTNLSLITLILLGISVSIDALGAGFSLLFEVPRFSMLVNSIIIGITASFLTAAGFKIIVYIKHIALVEKYASYLGGTILIILSLNLIIL